MTDFHYGQKVKLVLDETKTGMIIGETNWGDVYMVRLAGSLTTHQFESVELAPIGPEPIKKCGEVIDISDFQNSKKAG